MSIASRDHIHFTGIAPFCRWLPVRQNTKATPPQQFGELALDAPRFLADLISPRSQAPQFIDRCRAIALPRDHPGQLDQLVAELQIGPLDEPRCWALVTLPQTRGLGERVVGPEGYYRRRHAGAEAVATSEALQRMRKRL